MLSAKRGGINLPGKALANLPPVWSNQGSAARDQNSIHAIIPDP